MKSFPHDNPGMNDILDLPGWVVLSKRLDAGEYEIEAEYTVLPTACQKCGVLGRLYKHGSKTTTYRDSPIRGHAVRLLARVQRYKCRECGETFLQPLDGMQDSRLMTKRCAEFIQKQCLIDTFLRIAKNVGCDEKTVRALAGERIILAAQHGIDQPLAQVGMSMLQQHGALDMDLVAPVGVGEGVEDEAHEASTGWALIMRRYRSCAEV